MNDLFSLHSTADTQQNNSYSAKDIEVLEGLEPVRRRPGMYIGGTDDQALHHLVEEIISNAMDEVVAGHATRIEVTLHADGSITIFDNGRGIPIDPHPKFPDKSALEVILTTLHSGGKFSGKAYQTSGGLHGVGISVVNALSDQLTVEVVRDKTLWRQHYQRGVPTGPLQNEGKVSNRRGTSITFHPDAEIFGSRYLKPQRVFTMAKSKAYLHRGVEIRWQCDPVLTSENSDIPTQTVLHFANGILDYLNALSQEDKTVAEEAFHGAVELPDNQGRVEWALNWSQLQDGIVRSYCNTIRTPQGGTHETGLRAALLKGFRHYGEMAGNKKISQVMGEDVINGLCVVLSLFIREPQFQGQTKEKLVNSEVAKLVENALKDRFDHWLSGNTQTADALLAFIVARTEERLNRKAKREINRKSVTQRLRLPGKLTDCSQELPKNTEIFLVEGDSAGGSAKMARDRKTQAILPLRGKILNVASATTDKILANQEIADMNLALGCGMQEAYREEDLRYERIIIMTDADVDGAHIASLLMTFFYQQMPDLIRNGHLYLAYPPLYRLSQGGKSYYAYDEEERSALLDELGKKRTTINTTRFKGLGEMTPAQLKETTMDPGNRVLLKVVIAEEDEAEAATRVHELMGKKPELRFRFIQENASYAQKDALDV